MRTTLGLARPCPLHPPRKKLPARVVPSEATAVFFTNSRRLGCTWRWLVTDSIPLHGGGTGPLERGTRPKSRQRDHKSRLFQSQGIPFSNGTFRQQKNTGWDRRITEVGNRPLYKPPKGLGGAVVSVREKPPPSVEIRDDQDSSHPAFIHDKAVGRPFWCQGFVDTLF